MLVLPGYPLWVIACVMSLSTLGTAEWTFDPTQSALHAQGPWWQNPFNATPGNITGFNSYKDQCLLWDDRCKGDRDVALEKMFNNSGAMFNLVYKPCEYSEHRLATNCLPWLATPTLSTTMQSWFRKPECLSSWGEWHSKHPKENTWTWTEFIDNKDAIQTLGWDLLTQDAAAKTWGCCGMCAIAAGNVDVFYWPVSGANSECLKTIGTSIRPVDEGFFTYDLRGHKEFKSKPDPWATDKPLPAGNNPSHQMVRRFREILPTHNNSTATNGSAVSNHTIVGSTQVVSGYTLTSPTVYVGFSHVMASDRCGTLGSPVDYTMLPFQPGELSSIEVPVWQRDNVPASLTKSLNFADFPCPPMEVMRAIQYKPAPGEPYRPVLAPPPKVKKIQRGWENCRLSERWQGVDPPHALTAATVMAADPTPAQNGGKKAEEPQPGQALADTAPIQTAPPTVQEQKPKEKANGMVPADPDNKPAPNADGGIDPNLAPPQSGDKKTEGSDPKDENIPEGRPPVALKQQPSEAKAADPPFQPEPANANPPAAIAQQPSEGKPADPPSQPANDNKDVKAPPVIPNDDSKNVPSSGSTPQQKDPGNAGDVHEEAKKTDPEPPAPPPAQEAPPQKPAEHYDPSNLSNNQMSSLKDALQPGDGSHPQAQAPAKEADPKVSLPDTGSNKAQAPQPVDNGPAEGAPGKAPQIEQVKDQPPSPPALGQPPSDVQQPQQPSSDGKPAGGLVGTDSQKAQAAQPVNGPLDNSTPHLGKIIDSAFTPAGGTPGSGSDNASPGTAPGEGKGQAKEPDMSVEKAQGVQPGQQSPDGVSLDGAPENGSPLPPSAGSPADGSSAHAGDSSRPNSNAHSNGPDAKQAGSPPSAQQAGSPVPNQGSLNPGVPGSNAPSDQANPQNPGTVETDGEDAKVVGSSSKKPGLPPESQPGSDAQGNAQEQTTQDHPSGGTYSKYYPSAGGTGPPSVVDDNHGPVSPDGSPSEVTSSERPAAPGLSDSSGQVGSPPPGSPNANPAGQLPASGSSNRPLNAPVVPGQNPGATYGDQANGTNASQQGLGSASGVVGGASPTGPNVSPSHSSFISAATLSWKAVIRTRLTISLGMVMGLFILI